jgi:hypothetical protein
MPTLARESRPFIRRLEPLASVSLECSHLELFAPPAIHASSLEDSLTFAGSTGSF